MKNTFTREDEAALQAVAHELENVAERIRSRSWYGRDVGTLADVSGVLLALERRVISIVGDTAPASRVDWAAVSASRRALEQKAAALLSSGEKG